MVLLFALALRLRESGETTERIKERIASTILPFSSVLREK